MKANMSDPWNESEESKEPFEQSFEDTFVNVNNDTSRLPDSDQYLERLYSRLKALQKGSSKKDLVSSLAEAKEDCLARLITERRYLETEEEKELSSNPVIKLVAPHLQALTTSELVHLLKADALQDFTTEQYNETVQPDRTNVDDSSSNSEVLNSLDSSDVTETVNPE